MGYVTLFLTAFGAATLLPFGSEALYLYDLQAGYTAWLVWGVATAGNTLGSAVNYLLGRKGEAFLEQKGYLSSKAAARAKVRFRRFGGWALLFSWMPLVGDPLTFVAGMLRYPLRRFILIVSVAKGSRYALLWYVWVSSFSV